MRYGIKKSTIILSLIVELSPNPKIKNDKNLINDILKNIDYFDFISLNNGNLAVIFELNGIKMDLNNKKRPSKHWPTSFQNYLEYITSNRPKKFHFFWDYLTRKNDWLFPNGLHLIILEYDSSLDKYNIICPNFKENFNINKDIAFVIKNNNHFEPIYYYHKSSIPVKLFNIEDTEFQNIVKNFYDNYKDGCQLNYINNIKLIENT